jgi:hypothetical protein
MPPMKGPYIATSLSVQLSRLIEHFSLKTRFGYTITDKASKNHACIKLLATQLGINAEHRHVLCIGYIINLVVYEVLFSSDIEAFELELESTVTTELVELATWRKKGPISKLHNLIRYITHSSNRRDLFMEIQQRQLDEQQEQPYSQLRKHELIRDNLTRWNSWYDTAERVVLLRPVINEFVDYELADYHVKLVQWRGSRSQATRPRPVEPQIAHN